MRHCQDQRRCDLQDTLLLVGRLDLVKIVFERAPSLIQEVFVAGTGKIKLISIHFSAESFSMMFIFPFPQCGQIVRTIVESCWRSSRGAAAPDAGSGFSSDSKRRHQASFSVRPQLARKPSSRTRTNPRGKTCKRTRRATSRVSRVLVWLPRLAE